MSRNASDIAHPVKRVSRRARTYARMRPSELCLSSPKAPAFASHYKSPLSWMPCGVLVAQVQPMRPPVRKNVNASLGSVWGPGRATTAPAKLPRAPTRESDKGRWLEAPERARVVRRLASGGGKERGCAEFGLFGVMSLTLTGARGVRLSCVYVGLSVAMSRFLRALPGATDTRVRRLAPPNFPCRRDLAWWRARPSKPWGGKTPAVRFGLDCVFFLRSRTCTA